MTTPPRLQLTGIRKAYPGVLANDDVDLTVGQGEIHALLGENGAGKSTLVKIIYGVLAPDAGEISWEGREVTVASPHAARHLGIGMVFQHFSLFEALSVLENVALGFDEASARKGPRPADHRRQPRLWPAARPQARGARALCRRAPTHRDRPLPAAEPAPLDHGRAHFGADAAGGRPALPHPSPAGVRRRLDPLYQPQTAGDQSALRCGDHHARRQGRGALRPQGRDRAQHGPAHGGQRLRRAREAGEAAEAGTALSGQCPRPEVHRGLRHLAREGQLRRPGRRDLRHCRGGRQRPGGAPFSTLRRATGRARGHHHRRCPVPAGSGPAPAAALASPTSQKSATATPRSPTSRSPRTRCSPPSTAEH